MALSDADVARLAALRTTLDKMIGGQQVSKAGSGSNQIEFAPGSINDVRAEIAALEAKDRSSSRSSGGGAIRFTVR